MVWNVKTEYFDIERLVWSVLNNKSTKPSLLPRLAKHGPWNVLNNSLIKDFGEFCSVLIANSAAHRSKHMLLLFQFAHTLSAKWKMHTWHSKMSSLSALTKNAGKIMSYWGRRFGSLCCWIFVGKFRIKVISACGNVRHVHVRLGSIIYPISWTCTHRFASCKRLRIIKSGKIALLSSLCRMLWILVR